MNKMLKAMGLLGLSCVILIAACSPAASMPQASNEVAAVPESPVKSLPTMAPPPSQADSSISKPMSGGVSGGDPANGQMIIKNAEIDLLVNDTDIAIDRITQVVDDVNGYIVSSKTWYEKLNGDNLKFATITLGVPVYEFELSLRRIRDIAFQVTNESATGNDVSEEYVDLQSNLDSLQATRERIKGFLINAATVDEALKVNDQLSNIDKQINEIQGRMKYLSTKASFSNITITLHPQVVEKTPTPTYTPTPTATPTPWNPGATFKDAGKTLGSTYRGLATMIIWLVVVVIPVLLPFVLVGWGVIWGIIKLNKRKNKKDIQENKTGTDIPQP